MAIRFARATSPYRILCTFDSTAPLTAGSYAVARSDSGPGSPSVTLAFLPAPSDPYTAAIALSDALFDGVIYTVTVASVSVQVAYYAPKTSDVIKVQDDPEAQVFKVDLDWIDGDPDAGGDCPKRRGIACLDHDLQELAFLDPGDLVHKPEAGASVNRLVNSTSSGAELDEAAGKIEAEYRRDPRVESASVEVATSDDGNVELRRFVKPVALDDLLELSE